MAKQKSKKNLQKKNKAKNPALVSKGKAKMASSSSFFDKASSLKFLIPILILATFFAHFSSLQNDFVNYDDPVYVLENDFLTPEKNTLEIFSNPIAGNYHPLTILSLKANFAISGKNPFTYHLFNLILHLLNTLLVFGFIFLLTKRKIAWAFVVALLFGIHPLHVESVAWITARKDVLYAFFFLLGLMAYLKFIQVKKIGFYLLAFLFFVLALLSKPAAVIFPLILFLIDYFWERKFDLKISLEKIPFFIGSIALGIITLNIQVEEAVSFENFSFFQNLAISSYALLQYFIKAFLPINLSVLHPYPAGDLPIFYWSALALIIGSIGFGVKGLGFRLKGLGLRVFIFGFGFFLISLILVLQFVSVGRAVFAERYTYLAYIGLFFILGWIYDHFKNQQKTIGFGLLIFSGLMIFLSFKRNQVWKNSESLWSDVIEKYPNDWYAYSGRGTYFSDEGKLVEAVKDFSDGIKRNNNAADLYLGRGRAFRINREYDNAIPDLNKAIALDSTNVNAFISRGRAFFENNNLSLALKDFQKAEQMGERSALLFGNFGSIYAQQNQSEKALEYFNKSLEMDPNFANSYLNRGSLYNLLKNYEAAEKDFNTYYEIAPARDSKLYYFRGMNRFSLGKYQEAIEDLNRVIEKTGDFGDFYRYRSYCYNALGNKTQALQDAQKAQSLGSQLEGNYLQSLIQN